MRSRIAGISDPKSRSQRSVLLTPPHWRTLAASRRRVVKKCSAMLVSTIRGSYRAEPKLEGRGARPGIA